MPKSRGDAEILYRLFSLLSCLRGKKQIKAHRISLSRKDKVPVKELCILFI